MYRLKAFIIVSLISISYLVSGQDINAAGESFNEGLTSYKAGEYTKAIAAFISTIKTCKSLGNEGEELKFKSEQQLALSYYNYGKNLYKGKKYNDAIKQFELAAKESDKVGDDQTKDASNNYIAGLHTAIGNSLLKKEDFQAALDKYNLALTYKDDYIKAYYGMAMVYKKKEDYGKMKEAIDKTISMGDADKKTADKARSAAATTFQNAGAVELQRAHYKDAIDYLKTSTEYNDSDPMVYYYLAVAHNHLSEWNEAGDAANTAITKGYAEPSNAYFELGKAFAGLGNNTSACEAFGMVTAGANVDAAKYQMTDVLKCN